MSHLVPMVETNSKKKGVSRVYWVVVDYLYRDAGNHKAFGSVLLEGRLSSAEIKSIQHSLFEEGLFVAEQIGFPTLYGQLYRWSNGATDDDHCWHEWLEARQIVANEPPSDLYLWGTINELVNKIRAIKFWDGELSPHFYVGAPIFAAIGSLRLFA
jgi:hypothetical protein